MKNKIMKKWMLVLAIALCLNTVAFAEGEEPAVQAETAAPAQVEQVMEEKKVEAPQPVVEEKQAEAPAEPAPAVQAEAAAPAEEVTETVEIPAEPAAPAEVEAPAEPEAEIPAQGAEQAELPVEEIVVGSDEIAADETAPAPADDGTVEIDDYETPLGVTPNPAPFNASVQLQMRNQGEIYYGDMVTIEANITGATGAYAIRWEVDRHDENGWSAIAGQNGNSYDFIVTEDNASYDYRVVLTGQA